MYMFSHDRSQLECVENKNELRVRGVLDRVSGRGLCKSRDSGIIGYYDREFTELPQWVSHQLSI